ncbi:MAG: hypothetical protein HY744_34345 [Deltaproteobacteria bacterium]|nr:hypothetical protein [Deltaproteobacteria bacterium]
MAIVPGLVALVVLVVPALGPATAAGPTPGGPQAQGAAPARDRCDGDCDDDDADDAKDDDRDDDDASDEPCDPPEED